MNVVEILNDYMKMIGTFTRECSFLTVYSTVRGRGFSHKFSYSL